MEAKHNILIVEDEKAISNLISTTLETQGYHFEKAVNGAQALLAVTSHRPEVILLDLGLPDMDGLDIIRKVRGFSGVPIIVISARTEDQDKIDALDAGADDYLTKPFSVEELLARLRSTLRRLSYIRTENGQESTVFVNGELRLDFAAAEVTLHGEPLRLSPIEYKLLCELARNAGRVLTHQYLIGRVWDNGSGYDSSEISSLRVYMATLRKKIEPDKENPRYIQTRVGIGYKMNRI